MQLNAARARQRSVHGAVVTRGRARYRSTRHGRATPRPRRPHATGSRPPRGHRAIVIQYPTPAGRRRPLPGQALRRRHGRPSSADIFRDGHDILRAVVRYRGPGDARLARGARCAGSTPTSAASAGRARSTVDRQGRWQFTIEAWTDVFATWRDELERKVAAGQHDLAGELPRARCCCEAAASARHRATRRGADRARADRARGRRRSRAAPSTTPALGRELLAAVERDPSRARRRDARRSRSTSTSTACAPASAPGTSSSRAPGAASTGVEEQLPRLAELGFDVVYLPPIHPIGLTNRKGAQQRARRRRRATPAARGRSARETGGHDAVHPELGTLDDFDALVATAARARASRSRSTSRSSARPTTRG